MSHYDGYKFEADVILDALKLTEANPDTYIPSSEGVSAYKFPESGGMRFKLRSNDRP